MLVLRDRSGATADALLDSLKEEEIYALLTPVVAKDAVLVSDGARAYASFDAENGLGHVALDASKGERRGASSHIRNVNAYDSRRESLDAPVCRRGAKYLEAISAGAAWSSAKASTSAPSAARGRTLKRFPGRQRPAPNFLTNRSFRVGRYHGKCADGKRRIFIFSAPVFLRNLSPFLARFHDSRIRLNIRATS